MEEALLISLEREGGAAGGRVCVTCVAIDLEDLKDLRCPSRRIFFYDVPPRLSRELSTCLPRVGSPLLNPRAEEALCADPSETPRGHISLYEYPLLNPLDPRGYLLIREERLRRAELRRIGVTARALDSEDRLNVSP
jgi:hypothetical protein